MARLPFSEGKVDNESFNVDNNDGLGCQSADYRQGQDMSKVRERGEKIRTFILDQVDKAVPELVQRVAHKFAISRQAVNKHLQKLVAQGALIQEGQTRNRVYRLAPMLRWSRTYSLVGDTALAEDLIWRNDIAPILGALPENVLGIWYFGFTELFNNAIDHSEGTEAIVTVDKNAVSTEISIQDNGVGIFRKLQRALNLLDERHAVLELAKGKLTTDPRNHSGEGIFFSSRMFDEFVIASGSVFFSHDRTDGHDWILEQSRETAGTLVVMKLGNHSSRMARKIFDQYASVEYGFTKTVVPVSLVQYGDENLISRSQAKRLLTRVDRFRSVILDFAGVKSIGQAFADEIFRVFTTRHPDIEITPIHVSSEVRRMIMRVRNNRVE